MSFPSIAVESKSLWIVLLSGRLLLNQGEHCYITAIISKTYLGCGYEQESKFHVG
ncbi:MAG TPA: hypothetical protein VF242_13265 [Nitrososphaeraceae archaeon]